MIDMKIKEVNDRINLFFKLNTYTFLKNIYSKFYNGFIKKIDKDYIIFNDDELGEIPILIKEISEIDYSKKDKVRKDE